MVGSTFLYEVNDQQTRNNIIHSYTQMISGLIVNNVIKRYKSIGIFVDRTTPEENVYGSVNIMVEMPDERIITIEDYCVYLSANEQYLK